MTDTELKPVIKANARITWREAPTAAKALIIGTFVQRLGGFLQIFLVVFMTHRGFSERQAGGALGIYGAGMVLGVLIGGWASDRLGSRRTIIGSMVLTAVLLPNMLLLRDYAVLLVLVALIGAIGQAYRPASSSALSRLVPKSRHIMMFAMVRLATNLGTGIGPILGAGLAAISYDLLFWGEALAVLVFASVAMVALRNTAAGRATRDADDAPAQRSSAGYLTVLRDGRYLLFLLAILITSMVYMQYVSTLPLAVQAHGMPVMVYGVLVGLNGLAVVVCELLVAKRVQYWSPRAAAAAGVALTALGYFTYALPGGLPVFVVATLVWTFGECVGYPTLFYAYPAQAGPKELSGRYLGASNSMYGLGSALGPVIGIIVWNDLGNGLWVCCGAAGLVAMCVAWSGVVTT